MTMPQSLQTPESTLPKHLVLSISPLIRLTLWGFYLTLLLPLPCLAWVTDADVPSSLLFLGIGLGGLALHAVLSEKVHLDQTGMSVRYPRWVPPLFRSGWSTDWTDITELKVRATSQGGRVYYLLTQTEQAYLLPVRVVGFARMVRFIQAQTDLDMTAVKPLAQPWMYATLLLFTVILGLADLWILTTGMAAMGTT